MYAPLKRSYLTRGFHSGKAIDLGWISLGLRTPRIHAFDDGVVADVWFERNAGGNCIAIIHPYSDTQEILTLYAHLHTVGVVKDERVFGDMVIGLGGTTGVSTGPHLHFEKWIVPKGYKFDRNNYFRSDKLKYSVSPYAVINWQNTDSRKLGDLKMYNMDYSFQGKAKTASSILRMRTQPNLSSLAIGHMPKEALCVGKVVGKIDGHEWYGIIHNHRIVFVAAGFVTVEPNTKIVTKEVIKEVEKPFKETFERNGLVVTAEKKV